MPRPRPPKRTLLVTILWAVATGGWNWVSRIGNFQTIYDAVKDWPSILKWCVLILGTPWLPIVVALACLIAWWYLERGSKSGLWIELTPRWGAPLLATVINNDRDYPAHVKRSTLYGIRKDRTRERLYEAQKFRLCPPPPFTVQPERQMQQAYGGAIPFDLFNRLQVEIELENCKIVVSRKVKPPKPPPIPPKKSHEPSEAEQEEFTKPRHSEREAEDSEYQKAMAQLREKPAAPVAQPESVGNAQFPALREKLEMLLTKRKRIEATPSSPGFDMDQARRRNDLFITQVRDEIKRLEGEKSERTISFNQETEMIRILKAVEMRPIWLTIRMNAHKNDEEAYRYAMQVLRVLTQVGVTVSQCAIDLGTLFPDGVSLYCNDHLYNQPTAAAIMDAIKVTGVRCKRIDRQVWSQRGVPPEINLMIGSNEVTPPS